MGSGTMEECFNGIKHLYKIRNGEYPYKKSTFHHSIIPFPQQVRKPERNSVFH